MTREGVSDDKMCKKEKKNNPDNGLQWNTNAFLVT